VSTDERPRINWVQVLAGALAAMTSAVLLSTLGVAGTIIGAAVGSVAASVGSAMYGRGIHASKQQVAAQAAVLKRVAQARSQLDRVTAEQARGGASGTSIRRADEALDEAEQALHSVEAAGAEPGATEDAGLARSADEPPADDGTSEQLAEEIDQPADPIFEAEAGKPLPWRRIALVAAGLFLTVMLVITAFELLSGRTVSSFTGGSDSGGGTTVPGLGGTRDPGPAEPTDEVPEEPAVSESPEPTPTPAPATPPPTAEPTPTEGTATPSPAEPTPTPVEPSEPTEPAL
jgi:cell division septation protein DedD